MASRTYFILLKQLCDKNNFSHKEIDSQNTSNFSLAILSRIAFIDKYEYSTGVAQGRFSGSVPAKNRVEEAINNGRFKIRFD